MKIDAREVTALADAVIKASGPAMASVSKVVAKGALNIKTDAARRASGIRHAPAYPRSISYDLHQSMRGPAADIGPDKDRRQGALGNILEYGTIKNAPIPHIRPAADAEEPRFVRAMEDLAVKALGL
jgi:hypothetical protein